MQRTKRLHRECCADEDNTTWLGQSWFGTQWRRLINFNGFFSAGCLNGGLLGTQGQTNACLLHELHHHDKYLRVCILSFRHPHSICSAKGASNCKAGTHNKRGTPAVLHADFTTADWTRSIKFLSPNSEATSPQL